jgi:hypothetical protein
LDGFTGAAGTLMEGITALGTPSFSNPADASNGSAGGDGAAGSAGGTGGKGGNALGGGLFMASGTTTTAYGDTLDADKVGGGDGGDGGDGGNGGAGGAGGAGADVQYLPNVTPGNGGDGGNGGDAGDGGDGGGGGDALGGAVNGDATVYGGGFAFGSTDTVTAGDGGQGSDTPGTAGAAGTGGTAGTSNDPNVFIIPAVAGSDGTEGAAGIPGSDGLKGSESNNQDIFGTLTPGVIPLSVVLNPFVHATYGSSASASVSVTAPAPFANPPKGDKVVVQLLQNNVPQGSCTVTLPGGTGDVSSCPLPYTLPVGSYTVQATFQGATSGVGNDANFSSAVSGAQALVVTPASTTTSVNPLPPISVGQPAPVTAVVSPTLQSPVGQPSGTVLITASSNGTQAAQCTAPLTTANPDTATCDLGNALALGTYSVTATYASNGNYGTSSATATLHVYFPTTSGVHVGSPTVTFGDSVTYTANVTSPDGTPTGTVAFTTGNGLPLCTAPLVSGAASCNSTAAPVGVDTVKVSYSGDGTFGLSSGTTPLTVQVVVPAAPPQSTASDSETLPPPGGLLSVTGVPGISVAASGSGSVTVAGYGGNPAAVSVSGGTGVFYDVAVGRGSAWSSLSITVCNLGTGGNSLSWFNGTTWQPFSSQTYDSGSGCVAASISNATSPTLAALTGTVIAAVNVGAGDFSIGVSPTTAILNGDTSIDYTVTLTSSGGFSAPVSLSVSGLPAGVTGQFSPSTVTPTGTASLILTSPSSFTSGLASFTVNATGGGKTHTAGGSVNMEVGLVPLCFGEMSGTVTDSVSGLPVQGAKISYSGTIGQVMTTVDGTYDTGTDVNLGHNSGAAVTQVTANAPGYNSVTSYITVACNQVSPFSPSLVPQQFGTVTGHVFVGTPDPNDHTNQRSVTPTTTPIPGAHVLFNQSGTFFNDSATTGADGSYADSNLALGPDNSPSSYQVSASAPSGYWQDAFSNTASPTVSSGTPVSVDLALVPVCSGSISATLTSQDTGLPEVGANVQFIDSQFILHSATTDVNGNVSFDGVPLGFDNSTVTYSLTALTADERGSASASVTLPDCGDSSSASLAIHVPVANKGEVDVTVVDSTTGLPIPGATGSLVPSSESCVPDGGGGPADATGLITYLGVLTGLDDTTSASCQLTMSAAGYYALGPNFFVPVNTGQTTHVTVQLEPLLQGMFQGTVTDAVTGQPLAGVLVQSQGLDSVTDAAGHYSLTSNALLGDHNAPQLDDVSATKSGYLSAEDSVTVTSGQTSTLNFALTPQCGSAIVTGTVYNAVNQQPIPGATVEEFNDDQTSIADANGQFRLTVPVFNNVAFEDQLFASATGFNTATQLVHLFCGARVVADFGSNSTETGALFGTVTAAGTGQPVSGAFVGTSFGAITTTDASGNYSFTDVPLGNGNTPESWSVSVDPPAGSPLQPAIESTMVGPSPPSTELDFQLGTTPPPRPQATDDAFTTPVGETLTVPAPGVLANDTGVDVAITGNTIPHRGSLTFNPDGSFTYTPQDGFTDPASFAYTITDEFGVSSTATVTITQGEQALPGAFTVTPTPEDSQVQLGWTPSSGADSYTVYYATTQAGLSSSPTAACSATTSLMCTISPLTNGTTYWFEVVAHDAAGDTVSNQVSATPNAPPGSFTLHTPPVASGHAALSWSSSSGAGSYKVFYSTNSANVLAGSTACPATTNLTCDVTGLTNGTTYYFEVVAQNTIGTTDSNEVNVTPKALPGAVTVTPTPPAHHGYWLVGSDGGIFSFGAAQFYGSMGGIALQRPVVGIVPTRDRGGYWLDASDGGVFSFGNTQFYGSIPGLDLNPAGSGKPHSLNAPIVGMVPSHDQGGYFMVASDGGVFAFGDAHFAGSCPGIGGCSGAAVAVMPDASGNGYWLVTSTGSVYTFGDAPYLGAPGPQSSPITSAVAATNGRGYYVLDAAGQVFAYGDATGLGSLGAGATGGLNPASAIFVASDGGGYWVSDAYGDIYTFGDAPNDGSMAGTHLNGSIIAASGS